MFNQINFELVIVFTLIFYIIIRDYKRRKRGYSCQVLEFNGLPVSGYEENYLLTENDYISMSGLFYKQDIESISDQVATSFKYALIDEDNYWINYRQNYIKTSGRELPPVYKIKLVVEAELLSEKEIKQFWKKKQENELTID